MIGDRLRQARLAQGLTLDAVVERLAATGQPLTKAGLSKYETNKSTPTAAMLLKLAQALGVRPNSFLEEPAVTVEWVAFRKHPALSQTRQEQLKAFVGKRVEEQLWLQNILYPDKQPVFLAAYPACTPEEAEAAAMRLREVWGLGLQPIESVVRTTEDHGGIVVGWEADEGKFDGLAGWANGTAPVAVVNMLVSTDRRRYDLAHELGHMAMDCQGLTASEEERLAHSFAAAFLVPRDVAFRELSDKRRHLDLNELGILKRKYGLSVQSLARRARDLGIIADGQYRTLCIQFSRLGWRKREPVAYQGEEEPILFQQMTMRALAEGIITKERAAQLCPECIRATTPELESRDQLYLSAVELMKQPRKERERILAAAAAEAEADYREDRGLTDFEAFGEDDLYDETPSP